MLTMLPVLQGMSLQLTSPTKASPCCIQISKHKQHIKDKHRPNIMMKLEKLEQHEQAAAEDQKSKTKTLTSSQREYSGCD